jgi:hypothetical protein
MSGALGPETTKLLADVAGLPRVVDESPEARLARLAMDPVAVFAELNLRGNPAPHPRAHHPEAMARIAVALIPVAEPAASSKPGRVKVLHSLNATAPAPILPAQKEEKIWPFEPTAADISEAIDVVRLERYFPAVALVAAIAAAFLLWLLT